MEIALIFPVVVLVIAALAVVYGRWGPGKRLGDSGYTDRPRYTGADGTGSGVGGFDVDGGGL
jgi:hypothetical protein